LRKSLANSFFKDALIVSSRFRLFTHKHKDALIAVDPILNAFIYFLSNILVVGITYHALVRDILT